MGRVCDHWCFSSCAFALASSFASASGSVVASSSGFVGGPPSALAAADPQQRSIAELTGGLRSAGVDVALTVDSAADVPAPVQGVAYRIVQEALTNVARHAAAASATVTVRRVSGAIAVEVVDDGRGAGGAPGVPAPGNGLRGMREGAAALGGTLDAGPVDGDGWRVDVRIPA